MYNWFCNWEQTYLITAGDYIETMRICGITVTLADIKEFWETDDKVTSDYLLCVNSDLYRKAHQLKVPKKKK